MRKGNDPTLYFSKKGNLVAVATGADATTEHECGIKRLMSQLCENLDMSASIVADLKAGKAVKYPSILELRRINRQPKELKFQDVSSLGEAILSVCQTDPGYFKDELRFPMKGSTYADENLAGAWDEYSFAVRVRGNKYPKALKEFYGAILEKKVVFGGSFFKRPGHRFSGIVLVNTQYLSEEDKGAITKAQHDYESKLRLDACDESNLIMAQLRKMSNPDFCHIWASWADKEESAVVYSINPGSRTNADYGGSHSKDQILAWAQANGTYRLLSR